METGLSEVVKWSTKKRFFYTKYIYLFNVNFILGYIILGYIIFVLVFIKSYRVHINKIDIFNNFFGNLLELRK